MNALFPIRRYAGLALSEDKLALVCLSEKKRRITLEHAIFIPIAQPSSISTDPLQQALKTAAQIVNSANWPTAMALPTTFTLCKLLPMPTYLAEKDYHFEIHSQLTEYLPGADTDLCLDTFLLEKNPEENTILLAAARREHVIHYTQLARAAGFKIHRVSIQPSLYFTINTQHDLQKNSASLLNTMVISPNINQKNLFNEKNKLPFLSALHLASHLKHKQINLLESEKNYFIGTIKNTKKINYIILILFIFMIILLFSHYQSTHSIKKIANTPSISLKKIHSENDKIEEISILQNIRFAGWIETNNTKKAILVFPDHAIKLFSIGDAIQETSGYINNILPNKLMIALEGEILTLMLKNQPHQNQENSSDN